jgi:hypothetical protein
VKYRLLNLLALVSLLMCLAVVGLWVRSAYYDRGDTVAVTLFRSRPTTTLIGQLFVDERATIGVDEETWYVVRYKRDVYPFMIAAYNSRFTYFEAPAKQRGSRMIRDVHGTSIGYPTVWEFLNVKYVDCPEIKHSYFVAPLAYPCAAFAILPCLVAFNYVRNTRVKGKHTST